MNWLKRKIATFRGWSWIVISLSCSEPKEEYNFKCRWHFTFLLGNPGWGKNRWVMYHRSWTHIAKFFYEEVVE